MFSPSAVLVIERVARPKSRSEVATIIYLIYGLPTIPLPRSYSLDHYVVVHILKGYIQNRLAAR